MISDYATAFQNFAGAKPSLSRLLDRMFMLTVLFSFRRFCATIPAEHLKRGRFYEYRDSGRGR